METTFTASDRSKAEYAWRVIADGEGEACWNMAADEAIFQHVAMSSSPPTLRLYHWTGYAVTVGRFQDLERTLDFNNCAAQGIPVVRRITGGRGILHGGDLTVSMIASTEALGLHDCSTSTVNVYRRTAQLFIAAFRSLGIDAAMGGCARLRGQERIGNCFEIVSQADIVDRSTGRKLVGAALYRRGEYLLMQASVPLGTRDKQPEIQSLSQSVFAGGYGVISVPSGVLQARSLGNALVVSLSALYASRIEIAGLNETESACAAVLCATRYGAPEWNLAPQLTAG